MNRTRMVFFGVLVICLAILAASLAQQAISETALLQIFVASSIFGLGVVALDFLGVLGHHDADGGSSGGHTFGHVGDGHAGAGFGNHGGDLGLGGHAGLDHAGGAVAHGEAISHPGVHVDTGHHGGTPAHVEHGAEPDQGRAVVTRGGPNVAPVLSVLAYLRLLVYFCLGFGPAGWASLAGGQGPLVSLAIAVPFGLAMVFVARAFFRFQRRDTGVVLPEADLLREQATVIVPLDDHTMGKVRVKAGMTVTDLYARAADPGSSYNREDVVRIVRINDECVYVR